MEEYKGQIRQEHYLEMNDSSNIKGAHHKFYRMRLLGTHILINYGRIGHTGQTILKPAEDYNIILTSKLRKGYVDRTEGFLLSQEFSLQACV